MRRGTLPLVLVAVIACLSFVVVRRRVERPAGAARLRHQDEHGACPALRTDDFSIEMLEDDLRQLREKLASAEDRGGQGKTRKA